MEQESTILCTTHSLGRYMVVLPVLLRATKLLWLETSNRSSKMQGNLPKVASKQVSAQ